MMFKSDNYYYTDSRYQLELNLQSIRRELITMLEDFEKNDCTTCKQLKCRCSEVISPVVHSDSGRNSQNSFKSSHSKQDLSESKEAPPADLLPKPKWDEVKAETPESSTPEKSTKDVDAWVRTVTTTAPPNVPQYKRFGHDPEESAFNWSGLKAAWGTKKPAFELLGNINGVEAFFRSFKNPSLPNSSAQTNVSYMSSKLAAAFKITPKKSHEYTYF